MFEEIKQTLPIFIPLVVVGLIIVGAALLDIRKQASTRGPKWMWALIICLVTFIGPLAYFVVGRKEE